MSFLSFVIMFFMLSHIDDQNKEIVKLRLKLGSKK